MFRFDGACYSRLLPISQFYKQIKPSIDRRRRSFCLVPHELSTIKSIISSIHPFIPHQRNKRTRNGKIHHAKQISSLSTDYPRGIDIAPSTARKKLPQQEIYFNLCLRSTDSGSQNWQMIPWLSLKSTFTTSFAPSGRRSTQANHLLPSSLYSTPRDAVRICFCTKFSRWI